jgi:hypothetical protein
VFGRPADQRLLRTQHRLTGLREARKDRPAEEHEHALGGHAVELANQHGEGLTAWTTVSTPVDMDMLIMKAWRKVNTLAVPVGAPEGKRGAAY